VALEATEEDDEAVDVTPEEADSRVAVTPEEVDSGGAVTVLMNVDNMPDVSTGEEVPVSPFVFWLDETLGGGGRPTEPENPEAVGIGTEIPSALHRAAYCSRIP